MKIYPSIDILDGKIVRLKQGLFDEVTYYEGTPEQMAKNLLDSGAQYLHVVDLDGAKKGQREQNLANLFVKGLNVQVGGGVRTEEDVRKLLDMGCKRVVIGSLAIKDPDLTKNILSKVGVENVTLALDVKQGEDDEYYVATEGWKNIESVTLWSTLEKYMELGLKHLLCTDISRDGMLMGPNVDLYSKIIQRYPDLEVQASGGISSLTCLKQLRKTGVKACIIGKAFLEGRFTVSEALEC